MKLSSTAILSLLCGLLLVACGAPPPPEPAEPAPIPQDPAALEAIIQDIKSGWENADGEPFRRHFLDFPGARYVETGGQNEGLLDLIENHVEPEGEALELALTFDNVETHFEGEFAWTVTDVIVDATFRESGREIYNRGYSTYLFRWVDGAWKVVHTHNSTRSAER